MDTIKTLQSAQKIIVTHYTETWNFFYYYHFVDEYDILTKNKLSLKRLCYLVQRKHLFFKIEQKSLK